MAYVKCANCDKLKLGKNLLKVNNKGTKTNNTFKNSGEILYNFTSFTLVASNVLYDEVSQNTHVANCGGRLYRLPSYLDTEKKVMLHFLRLPPRKIIYPQLLQSQ